MVFSVPAIAVLLQALIVAGYGVYLGVETVVADAADPVAAIVMAAFCLALAVALAVLARGVALARRWAYAPVLLWQVLLAAVAVPALRSDRWQVGVGLLLLCAVVAVGVLRDAASSSSDQSS